MLENILYNQTDVEKNLINEMTLKIFIFYCTLKKVYLRRA